jgi:hypothetical protein
MRPGRNSASNLAAARTSAACRDTHCPHDPARRLGSDFDHANKCGARARKAVTWESVRKK